VIGLEIHVQLSTRTKMFCGCEPSFGDEPNVHTCPVCLGLPGTLPVVNAQAIRDGVLIGLALQSQLTERSIFARKNYFYPDLPKGYQISQYDTPLCRGGRLGDVRIHRVHLEEDAAKLVHVSQSGRIHGSEDSVVDFNRGGTPLVEIVTEPDLRSPEDAREWLTLLRTTLRALGVSDVDMSQGSLRCDANVSIRPRGDEGLGVKTELKNMNSFRFLEQGVRAEIARQAALLDSGERVEPETLHFDPQSGTLSSLRSKEEAHDYRYFPEPDLVPVVLDQGMVEHARAALPELPAARAARYQGELGLSADSAHQLGFHAELGDYFERALAAGGTGVDAQTLAHWVARVGAEDPAATPVTPEALAGLVRMLGAGEVTQAGARQVLDALLAEGGDPGAIVAAQGLRALRDSDALAGTVAAAIEANADAAASVRAGNDKAMGPIVGAVMRETRGRADGGEVRRLVREHLGLG
jgi:aspartyl-tRNA(Asn)/glutamyl-tRNA(Gln) amidotransferase subunit B